MELDSEKLMDRGENHLMSGHLRAYCFVDSDEKTTYYCSVQSSMKSMVHEVELSITKSNICISGTCKCARGAEAPCSHMATVLLYINRNVSCTDKLATWSQRGTIEYPMQTIEEMVGKPPTRKLPEEEKTSIREKLLSFFKEHCVAVPAVWILKGDEHDADGEEPSIGDRNDLKPAIENVDFALCDDRKAYLARFCAVTTDEIAEIANATVGQRKNVLYCRLKSYRLTASNFGYVIAAIQRGSYPASLFGRLLNTSNLEKVKAIQWGIQNEDKALETLINFEPYKNNFNAAEIRKSGLHVHTSGILAASPMGNLVKIPKNPQWEENLTKLQTFYYNNFIPHILSQL